jgi:hypothetical protein
MDSSQLALIAALAVVLVVALVVLIATRRKRSRDLSARFGPEYDRTVAAVGRKTKAEKELEERARRVAQLHVRALTSAERHRFAELWRVAQERFVDSPAIAVAEADQLVTEVMRVRGYPMADFETRAADVSVDHPQVVSNYRAAHAHAERSRDGKASTEDLRQAMVHYRALFEELLLAPSEDREPELVHH